MKYANLSICYSLHKIGAWKDAVIIFYKEPILQETFLTSLAIIGEWGPCQLSAFTDTTVVCSSIRHFYKKSIDNITFSNSDKYLNALKTMSAVIRYMLRDCCTE